MAGQDLQSLGCAPDVGGNNVEQDVGNDAPVEVECHLTDEQHDETDVDVLVSQEHPDGEEDGAEDDSNATDQWISPGVPGLQSGGEDHAQRHPHYARHHRHHTEDKLNIIHVNFSVLLVLGQEAFLDEVWTKPGESSEAEGDAGEAEGRIEETLVPGETYDVLLKLQSRSVAVNVIGCDC